MFNKIFKLLKYLFSGKIVDVIQTKLIRYRIKNDKLKDLFEEQYLRLESILKYSVKHCEFYRKLNIKVATHQDIKKFPLLDKTIIRENYQDLLSDNYANKLYWVGYTGGSTGEPLKLLLHCGVDDIFQERLFRKYNYSAGDIILAMDGSVIEPYLVDSHIFWQKVSNQQLPYGGYVMSSLYLDDKNIKYYVEYILNLKPAFIRGYPSFVARIATYIVNNNINIGYKMKGIELTSETSFGWQREIISSAFKCNVFMQYGHTENIVFGYTYDSTMKYIVDPIYGYTEILNEEGQHVNVGEIGEIVVTTLYNRVMPLIRYRTGDLATFEGYNEQGIVISEILGRCQDYIVNIDGTKVLLTALVFAQHFEALEHIIKWQIEQFVIGEIEINIVKDKNYSAEDEKEILLLFEKKGYVHVKINYVDNIGLTPRGKFRMCIQHLPID